MSILLAFTVDNFVRTITFRKGFYTARMTSVANCLQTPDLEASLSESCQPTVQQCSKAVVENAVESILPPPPFFFPLNSLFIFSEGLFSEGQEVWEAQST